MILIPKLNRINLIISDDGENQLCICLDEVGDIIVIKNGDNFIAETNSKYVNFKQDKNRLHITERNHNWFNNYDNNEVIVYVPSFFELTFPSLVKVKFLHLNFVP